MSRAPLGERKREKEGEEVTTAAILAVGWTAGVELLR
jgi:hypothetical protein